MKKNKRGIDIFLLIMFLIAVVVLAVVLTAYFIAKGKGIGAIEFAKNLLRFRV